MHTYSDLDVSVKSDTSEPHVPTTIVDSVTAVLSVQKIVFRNHFSTKLKHFQGVAKTAF